MRARRQICLITSTNTACSRRRSVSQSVSQSVKRRRPLIPFPIVRVTRQDDDDDDDDDDSYFNIDLASLLPYHASTWHLRHLPSSPFPHLPSICMRFEPNCPNGAVVSLSTAGSSASRCCNRRRLTKTKDSRLHVCFSHDGDDDIKRSGKR